MGALQLHAFAQSLTFLLSKADSPSGCTHVLHEEVMGPELIVV